MEDELKDSRVSILIHLAAGAAMGLVSPLLGRALYSVGLGLVASLLLGHLMERVVGKRKLSWWLGNGLFIYLCLARYMGCCR
jgi:hypothetical protein